MLIQEIVIVSLTQVSGKIIVDYLDYIFGN
jgi:hypothetical protein